MLRSFPSLPQDIDPQDASEAHVRSIRKFRSLDVWLRSRSLRGKILRVGRIDRSGSDGIEASYG